ncbi:MAG: hypothetical protein IJU02_07415 [Lachnospiraceae bacterium]|nr:hypothetical protein [Lachnospiraceae bacterium]
MEEKKKFSKFFIASLKRTAQNVYPLVRRKNKLLNEIEEKSKELEELQVEIDQYQYPIATATGGYTTEDLVERVVVTTDKVDKDGKPVKVTQYNLKFPDTIVPDTPKEQMVSTNENVEAEKQDSIEAIENAVRDFNASINI